jgi:hypothetical protein
VLVEDAGNKTSQGVRGILVASEVSREETDDRSSPWSGGCGGLRRTMTSKRSLPGSEKWSFPREGRLRRILNGQLDIESVHADQSFAVGLQSRVATLPSLDGNV